MPTEKTPTTSRQGERGRSMLTVLTVSILLAAGLAIAAYVYVFQADEEELAEPIPATETVPDDDTGDAAAAN